MEILQLLPPAMLVDSVLLSTVDGVEAAISALKAYRLKLIADLDQRGLATEQGARDTVELLSLRHHLNRREVKRDLKLAKALPKYDAVTTALPDPTVPAPPRPDSDDTPAPEPDDASEADTAPEPGDAPVPVVLTPDQADAIVTTLEKAPPSVPGELLRVAEEQMIEAARHLSPDELLAFGREVLARLDTDGPEPAENDAAAKETLTLRRAEGGVKFSGFLAGENGELLRTQINRLAKPHRTVDGELDPRPPDKRYADALTMILNAAAGNTPRTDESLGNQTARESRTSPSPSTSKTSATPPPTPSVNWSTATTCPLPRCAGWRVMPRSSRSCSARIRSRWMSGWSSGT